MLAFHRAGRPVHAHITRPPARRDWLNDIEHPSTFEARCPVPFNHAPEVNQPCQNRMIFTKKSDIVLKIVSLLSLKAARVIWMPFAPITGSAMTKTVPN